MLGRMIVVETRHLDLGRVGILPRGHLERRSLQHPLSEALIGRRGSVLSQPRLETPRPSWLVSAKGDPSARLATTLSGWIWARCHRVRCLQFRSSLPCCCWGRHTGDHHDLPHRLGPPLSNLPTLKDPSVETYAILVLTLTFRAYVAEVYRAGIESTQRSPAVRGQLPRIAGTRVLRYQSSDARKRRDDSGVRTVDMRKARLDYVRIGTRSRGLP